MRGKGQCTGWVDRIGWLLGIAAAVWVASRSTAVCAQFGRDTPDAIYYAAIEELYSGELRDAEAAFRREIRSAIKTPQARWIDSICYHAMLGEVLYQQGRNPEALAEFDQACQLLLSYPNWLLQVQFRQPPRPDPNRARQAPPWGHSERQFTLGYLPPTMLVSLGRIDQRDVVERGGVVQMAQFWKVNGIEVIRCSALAIRRRNELLGPLAPHDRLSKELAAIFSRGGNAPLNHWSTAWVDLQAGVAQAGIGNTQEALTHLSRALVLDGRYDHPLTPVVLLEQGKLALRGGNSGMAARLFAEASYSAFYWEDWGVLLEALQLGHLSHVNSNAPGPYPPLEAAAQLARVKGLRALEAQFKLAHAESLALAGQTEAAAALLNDAGRRLGEMRTALPGVYHLYLNALVGLDRRRGEATRGTLSQALAAQAAVSQRNFQIGRLNAMYDAREVSARIALELYKTLLDDPTASDWAYQPIDAMAYLQTVHDEAFDRWFLAALERGNAQLALEIADRAKRRHFHGRLPMGGRLLALRTMLDRPPADLPKSAALERDHLLAAFPDYKALSQELDQVHENLRDQPLVPGDDGPSTQWRTMLDRWDELTGEQEAMLASIAVRRVPSSYLFPPLRTSEQLQQALSPGEALVVFHAAAGELYGFALTADDYTAWRLGPIRRLRGDLVKFLNELGNYGPNHDLTAADLVSDDWRPDAQQMFDDLFAESHLSVAQTHELIIVPHDLLWYVPFEACVLPDKDGSDMLLDRTRIRYAPTAGLAVGDTQPFRRIQRSAVAAGKLLDGESDQYVAKQLDRLKTAMSGAVQLSAPLPVPAPLVASSVDELVVLEDLDVEAEDPYGWSPLPNDRRREDDGLASWLESPFNGPERIVLTGFPTAAETGLKGARRRARSTASGDDVFHAVCGLMATGARTALVSRWRTGGKTNLDLVREFVQELPHVSATEAWQRSVLLARASTLDVGLEPRLRRVDDIENIPSAEHPFFWAGYLLIDTGYDPATADPGEDANQPEPVIRFREKPQDPAPADRAANR